MKRLFMIIAITFGGLAATLLLTGPADTFPAGIGNDECLECHADIDEVGEQRLVVKADFFKAGPHEDNACIDCHTAAGEVEDIYDHGPLGRASCSDDCHGDQKEEIASSAHSIRRFKDKQPDCYSCHAGPSAGGDAKAAAHGLRRHTDPASPAHRLKQPETCAQCHQREIIDNYLQSTHGQLLTSGSSRGPTCSQCHSPHRVVLADINRNPQFKLELTRNACGSGDCHPVQMAEYAPSIHGKTLLEDNVYESASCADCHYSHRILPPDDPKSTVYPTNVVGDCAGCHSDSKLIRRFNLPSNVVGTFKESYHGRASNLGEVLAANCSSCHENHAIYTAADERSSVYPANLAKTCGHCHPGANENFILGRIHTGPEDEENYWPWLIANFYTWLIVLLIGGMVIHNIFDFTRKMINRNRQHKNEPHVVRMTRLERILHLTLLTSFILLAYSGFALVFPDAWWVAPLNLISNTEEFRSVLHRVCGVILTFVAVHHLWFLFFNKRGREQRRRFMPRLRDVRDFKDNILFFVGRRKQRPNFPRFSYIEKAEYWALVWGTAVMVLTGFILWFQEIAMMFIPLWLWEVFNVIHFYEAILAVLAIVVWHFYYVFINPDEAPMALTWLTGRMTLKELAKVHPEEYEEVMKARDSKEVEEAGE
jgi:formate dehydrogenase gamma subunit